MARSRTYVDLYLLAGTSTTTETLLSLTPTKNGVASGAVTSYAIPSGKVLVIQSFLFGFRNHVSTSFDWVRHAVRHNPSGTVVTTSPILAALEMSAFVLNTESRVSVTVPLYEPIEILNGQIGVSSIGATASNQYSFMILGYEY